MSETTRSEPVAPAVGSPLDQPVGQHWLPDSMREFERNVAAMLDAEERLLQEHQGKWVLLNAGQVVDLFDDYKMALGAGYERFGLSGFLVHEIQPPTPAGMMWRQRQKDATAEYESWFSCLPNG